MDESGVFYRKRFYDVLTPPDIYERPTIGFSRQRGLYNSWSLAGCLRARFQRVSLKCLLSKASCAME